MRFAERELKPYAEPVTPDQLRVGETYFGVHFLDEDGFVPVLEPKVFIGHNLEPEDKDELYFQDYASYRGGPDMTPPRLRIRQFLKLAPRNTSSNTNERLTCYWHVLFAARKPRAKRVWRWPYFSYAHAVVFSSLPFPVSPEVKCFAET
jgi:hypothetical protein